MQEETIIELYEEITETTLQIHRTISDLGYDKNNTKNNLEILRGLKDHREDLQNKIDNYAKGGKN